MMSRKDSQSTNLPGSQSEKKARHLIASVFHVLLRNEQISKLIFKQRVGSPSNIPTVAENVLFINNSDVKYE